LEIGSEIKVRPFEVIYPLVDYKFINISFDFINSEIYFKELSFITIFVIIKF